MGSFDRHDDTRRRVLLATLVLPATSWAREEGTDFWPLAREGGNVFLMRHASTEPGTGDPPNFTLGNCATQRNLSERGRREAKLVGERFASEKVQLTHVRSSAWCRCIDTAQLAFGEAKPQVWSALNSFFQGQGDGDAKAREVLQATGNLRVPDNWMLVTHQVNITQLTGVYPAVGEILLTRPVPGAAPSLRVLARWTP